jgi:hypothetical protein
VFTWRTPPLTDTSRVIIDIQPLDHGCDVTVTHEMSPEWEPFVDRAASAWQTMMDAMAKVVERG